MKTLRIGKRADGVAVITLDTPESPVNVLTRESLADLNHALDEVEGDPEVRACVLASAKPGNFLAGADLDALSKTTAAEARELSRRGQAALERVERFPKPVVAAVDGAALGGGLEVVLACRGRVAAESPRTVFALPEVQLGLLPGAGGTQRLPRLIGLRESLGLVLTGNRVRASKALSLGLVDAVVAPGELLDAASREALRLAANGVAPRAHVRLLDRALGRWPLRPWLLRQARKSVLRKTRGHYPAPLAILDAVAFGLAHGVERGLERESEHFGSLVASPEARNLVWLFHASQELKKVERRTVGKIAVLGAGLMGKGITSVSLPLSEVILRDVSPETLDRARASIESQLDRRARSGSLAAADRELQRGRLRCVAEPSGIQGAELVIEAVFENLELKRKVLREVEEVVSPTAVFASNTSALPIAAIAAEARHPERVLGMHYFSPVPKMPLLEIVVAARTSPEALGMARAYGVAQGKTVIVVKDGPGFYTTRILAPLLGEAMLLLEEGASVEAVDDALKSFGFPMGPLALIDEVGIDVGAHVARDLGAAFSARWDRRSDALEKLVGAGYAGRKNRRGFYRYPKGLRGGADEAIYGLVGASARKRLDPRELADRLVFVMLNEAVRCLEEGVIACPRDGDVGAILGVGFPPFRGGPFHHLDRMGLSASVGRLEELAAAHGNRFQPAPILQGKLRSEAFYREERPQR